MTHRRPSPDRRLPKTRITTAGCEASSDRGQVVPAGLGGAVAEVEPGRRVAFVHDLLGQPTRTAAIGLAADLLAFAVSGRGGW